MVGVHDKSEHILGWLPDTTARPAATGRVSVDWVVRGAMRGWGCHTNQIARGLPTPMTHYRSGRISV